MEREINGYIEYLSTSKEVEKPTMPYFDISAYTDNEYTSSIYFVMKDYENVDDISVTLKYLRGE